jgi:integrase
VRAMEQRMKTRCVHEPNGRTLARSQRKGNRIHGHLAGQLYLHLSDFRGCDNLAEGGVLEYGHALTGQLTHIRFAISLFGRKISNNKGDFPMNSGAIVMQPHESQTEKLPRGIFERNARYYYRFAFNDKLYRFSAGRSQAQAEKLLAVARNSIDNGRMPDVLKKQQEKKAAAKQIPDPKAPKTFGDALDLAIIEQGRKDNRDTTVYNYTKQADTIREDFGSTLISEVAREDIVDWLKEMAEGRDWSGSTFNKWITAFSLAFKAAKVPNLTEGITKKQVEDGRVRFLSTNEEAALLTSIAKVSSPEDRKKNQAIFQLSIYSGMRRSEEFRGKGDDYSDISKLLAVHQRKNRHGATIRHVPLGKKGVAAYKALARGKERGELLIDQPVTSIRSWFEAAVKDAGIQDYTWHDNRHTAATRWVMGGVVLRAVADYLGHTRLTMVMRYSHLVPGIHDKAREVMDAY